MWHVQIAFDGKGKPTKALQGYCSKNGIQPDQVTREADSKGTEYVWAEKQIPGKAASEVCPPLCKHADVYIVGIRAAKRSEGKAVYEAPAMWSKLCRANDRAL